MIVTNSVAGTRNVVVLAILFLGVLSYANTFTGAFVWDDASSVLLHRHVQDPAQFFQLFREDQHAFGRGQGNFYRPLVSVSFMVDYQLTRWLSPAVPSEGDAPPLSPFVFHVTNLLWHLAAALLMHRVLLRMQAPPLASTLVPLLFVAHPLHTEAIAYISGRADPMSAALMFAGLAMALRPGAGIVGAVGSTLFFAAALCSKESAMMYPALLAILLLGRAYTDGTERPIRDLFRQPAALAAVATLGGYILLRVSVLKFASGGGGRGLSLFERGVETCQSFALYIKLLFIPTGLHMERSLAGVPGWLAAIGLVLLAGSVAWAAYGISIKRYGMTMGMAWFLATWFPISGLIPLNAPMAEHWLYVPMAGFFWALSDGLDHFFGAPRAQARIRYAACALCLLFVFLSLQRNWDWRSNEALFRATLAMNPHTARVHHNLAITYEDELLNDPGARRHYEHYLSLSAAEREAAGNSQGALTEQELEAHVSLATVYMDERNYGGAGQHYAVAASTAVNPNDKRLGRVLWRAYYGLGRCYLQAGEREQAIAQFRKAIAIRPELRGVIQQDLSEAPQTS
jgi:hypothetical protein